MRGKQQHRVTGPYLARLGHSPNWYIRWRIPGSNTPGCKSTGTSNEAEAQAILARWVLENLEPEKQTAVQACVGLIVQRYYDEHAQHLRSGPSAKISCARLIEYFGAMSVGDLADGRAVRSYIKKLQTETVLRDASINKDLMCLGASLNRAHSGGEHQILTERPPKIQMIREDDFRVPEQEAEIFSAAQLRELFQRAARHEHLFRIVLVLTATGCRPEAGLQLAPRQVDLDLNLIDLNLPGRKQNKKRRPIVPIPAVARPYFEMWMRDADRMVPFVTYEGKPIGSFIRLWHHIVRRDMGLEGRFIPYSLRHTISTMLSAAGLPEEEIGKHLGHHKSTTTKNYLHKRALHASPNYLRLTTDGINAILTDALKGLPAPRRVTWTEQGNVVTLTQRAG